MGGVKRPGYTSGTEKIGKNSDLQHGPIGIADRLQNGRPIAQDNAGGYSKYCAEDDSFRQAPHRMRR